MDDQERSVSATASSPTDPNSSTLGFAALAALMQERAQAGWVWDEKTHTLTHPQDRQLQFAIDPATRQLSLSPKLAEQLMGRSGPQPQEQQS
jgi:hypothetical protein